MTSVVAVDVGKTGCRAVLWITGTGSPRRVREVPGAPGLAAAGGVDATRAAVRAAVLPLLEEEAASRLISVCVGAAGAATAPAAARDLASRLLEDLPAQAVAVASDAVTAHAGALGGRAGVVLAIGTGSVAVGIGADGSYARVDGWGPWLGDEGSGAWIGAAGLRAALHAHDGRGPATTLLSAATDRFGDIDRLPLAIGRNGNPARAAASFAPDVARAAAAGDAAASSVIREAATALGRAVLAAADRIDRGQPLAVAITGGLTGLGAPLMDPVEAAITGSGRHLHLTPPQGDPLDGARLLALNTAAPHEPHIIRLRRMLSPAPRPHPPVSPPATV